MKWRPDNALSGGETGPGEDQQGGFQAEVKMTHDLVVRRRVSGVDFGETKQHTNWWQDRATIGSAGWGGDQTTHKLMARQGHGRVSLMDFGKETRQRTNL